MSYTLQVLAIDFGKLEGVPGCRDGRLLAALHEMFEEDDWGDGDDDDDDDDWHDDDNDDGVSEDYAHQVSPSQALENIINGTIPRQKSGGESYYEALALLYFHFGTEVGALHLSSHEVRHLREVEEALSAKCANPPLSLLALSQRGTPFHVPAGEPFPSLGYLTPSEVKDAHEAYAVLSLDTLPVGARDTVAELGRWLETAAGRSFGLVGILG